MEQDKRQAVALMRYSIIAPLITGMHEDYPSRNAFFRDASLKGVIAPDGSVRNYAPGTIEKWYLAYKQGGFDALLPTYKMSSKNVQKIWFKNVQLFFRFHMIF